MRPRRSRPLNAAALALMLSVAVASSAQAGLLVSSAPNCNTEVFSQPFLRWLDPNSYTLAPGGSFERGTAQWALAGGAAVTSGNESYHVNGSRDSQSLSLPSGSSATSPSVCVGIDHPTLRLFARNSGSVLSTVEVEVLFEDAAGHVLSAPIGVLTGGAAWQPTLPIAIVANLLPLLPNAETAVEFRFTPLGLGGGWHIDDVYVDPWRRS